MNEIILFYLWQMHKSSKETKKKPIKPNARS